MKKRNWMRNRSKGVDGYAVAGILIAIAILLGVIFHEQIGNLITTIFQKLQALVIEKFF